MTLRRERDRIVAESVPGGPAVRLKLHGDGLMHAIGRRTEDPDALGAVARALAAECARTGERLLSVERDELQVWNEALATAGFEVYSRKILVERELEPDAAVDPAFDWRTLEDLGDRTFLRWLERCAAGDPAEDAWTGSAQDRYEELLAYAGERLDRTLWRVAVRNAGVAGIVLPQALGSDPPQGTLAYVGVVPERRGEGLGRRLHAAGLGLLARAGVRRYVGSTDVRNEPMRRVFAANGCHVVTTQLFCRI